MKYCTSIINKIEPQITYEKYRIVCYHYAQFIKYRLDQHVITAVATQTHTTTKLQNDTNTLLSVSNKEQWVGFGRRNGNIIIPEALKMGGKELSQNFLIIITVLAYQIVGQPVMKNNGTNAVIFSERVPLQEKYATCIKVESQKRVNPLH